jgi:nitrite reductase (NO-forming)
MTHAAAPRHSEDRERRYRQRVRIMHHQTRISVALALVFVVASAVALLVEPERWLALHLFLAGAVTVTVSAVSLMLTVTWAAAPAPPNPWVALQRLAVVGGAAGVAVARQTGQPDWVGSVAGGLYLLGLAVLAYLLVTTVRAGRDRRFDVAVAHYLVAIVAALAGVGVGVHMAASGATTELRGMHVTLNLLGFVGITIAGTLPFFAATVARSRMARHATTARLGWLLAGLVVALGSTVVGVAIGSDLAIFAGLGGYAYAVLAVLYFLPRPTRRQLDWSGPRLVALWLGGAWWVVALAATAYGAAVDDGALFLDRWMLVMVIAGYGQIVWGSLAYLIPMLRGGGPEHLSEGFARTRSWVGLASVNVAGVALVLDQPASTLLALAVTVIDGIWRTHQVGLRHLARPDELFGQRHLA